MKRCWMRIISSNQAIQFLHPHSISHLISHHRSSNTFGPTLWPFCLPRWKMCQIDGPLQTRVWFPLGGVMSPLSGLTNEMLILKRCRLNEASWKIIQRDKNRRVCLCVRSPGLSGTFTSKSWRAYTDKWMSLTITSFRFHSAEYFSVFDWAPGWTISWLFTGEGQKKVQRYVWGNSAEIVVN